MALRDSIHKLIYKFVITLAISVSELKNLNSPEVSLKANLQFTSLNAKSTSGIPLVISRAFANNDKRLFVKSTLYFKFLDLLRARYSWVRELQLLNLTITCCWSVTVPSSFVCVNTGPILWALSIDLLSM